MKCAQVQRLLPGYLDGALPDRRGSRGHARIAQHLDTCAACRQESERYRELSMMMSSISPVQPPEDLSVSIRIGIAKAREAEGLARKLLRWKNTAELVLENILEPLALPATAGVVVALLVFSMVYQVLGAGIPLTPATPDSPTNLLQPARLEMLAGFGMSRLEEMSRTGGQHPLLVEATVSAEGQAVSYRVLSGHVDATAQRELDEVLLFSRFRPQMSFGRPRSGGIVVLSFNQISVHG
jgi:Putative zinc-finger